MVRLAGTAIATQKRRALIESRAVIKRHAAQYLSFNKKIQGGVNSGQTIPCPCLVERPGYICGREVRGHLKSPVEYGQPFRVCRILRQTMKSPQRVVAVSLTLLALMGHLLQPTKIDKIFLISKSRSLRGSTSSPAIGVRIIRAQKLQKNCRSNTL